MVRHCSMVVTTVMALMLPLAAMSASPQPCPEGLTEDWRADFCALRSGTDAVEVSRCIEIEKQRRFEGSCAAKLEYKRSLCAKAADIGGGSAERCLSDPRFLSDAVRRRLAAP